MKILLAAITAISLIILPVNKTDCATKTESELTLEPREIKSELYTVYKDLIKKTIPADELKRDDSFVNITEYPYKNMEVEVIDYKVDSISASIFFDKRNNTYFYLEADYDSTNSATLFVNNKQYTIVSQGFNLYLLDNNGQTFQFVISEDENSLLPKTAIITNVDRIRATNASWIFMSSGNTRTETSYLPIIEVIANVSGALYDVFQHPIFGTITILAGYIIGSAGNYAWLTLYIVYDLYYRSDCTTYYKEDYSCYADSAHQVWLKNGIRYYHSVRPDYAGQNCVAYGWY